jgi:hypothetical protein
MQYKYSLEAYNGMSSRYNCPKCGHREFTRYINTVTNQHVSDIAGRCSRENKCGYHYTPSRYFTEHKITEDETTSFIPDDIFRQSLSNHENNNLVKFLMKLYGSDEVKELIKKYYLGTCSNGAAVFWQIDMNGGIRSGKMIQYDQLQAGVIKNI